MKQTKKYGVYHWDTFDNETMLISQSDTLDEAKAQVQKKYAGRIGENGADVVEILDENRNVVGRYSVR